MYASGHSFGWFCLPRPATARRLSRLASLEIWCASHAPILQSEPGPLYLWFEPALCTRHAAGTLPRRLPLWWRTPRTTLRLGHTRGARHAPRSARTQRAPRSSPRIADRAPRCTAHHAPRRATRCATHHPCALAIVGPGPPGAAAHKRTPGAHPFSRAVFVGARACRPFCTTRRAAPRTLRHAAPRRATPRHAAPRRATHAADVITLAGASPNDPGRLLVSVGV